MESSEEQTVAIGFNPELGYGTLIPTSTLYWITDFDDSYAPGDGFVYFILSAQGRSNIRRLGLIHMSDAWKAHMFTHYELKKPARRPCDPFAQSRRAGGSN